MAVLRIRSKNVSPLHEKQVEICTARSGRTLKATKLVFLACKQCRIMFLAADIRIALGASKNLGLLPLLQNVRGKCIAGSVGKRRASIHIKYN
jgi:hypothetical protein